MLFYVVFFIFSCTVCTISSKNNIISGLTEAIHQPKFLITSKGVVLNQWGVKLQLPGQIEH